MEANTKLKKRILKDGKQYWIRQEENYAWEVAYYHTFNFVGTFWRIIPGMQFMKVEAFENVWEIGEEVVFPE